MGPLHPRPPPIDTLRWAHGDVRLCDCPACWESQPAWRYAELLAARWQRQGAEGGRAGLSRFLFEAVAVPNRRLRITDPPVWRAAEALRHVGRDEGLHPGALYEALLRGLARNWPGARDLPPR